MTYRSKYTSGPGKTEKESYAQAVLQLALIESLEAEAAKDRRDSDERKAADEERQRRLDRELEELERRAVAHRAGVAEIQRKLDERKAATRDSE